MTPAKVYQSVDEYISTFPETTQEVLQALRALVKKVAPQSEDVISYNIPAAKLDDKMLIYYAGWKQHVSVYPTPKGDPKLLTEVAPYIKGRGTLQFPLQDPIPYDLIERVIIAARDAPTTQR
jgi:uncharacterized protein YdhG (YjbR/CyaY superfamily)